MATRHFELNVFEPRSDLGVRLSCGMGARPKMDSIAMQTIFCLACSNGNAR